MFENLKNIILTSLCFGQSSLSELASTTQLYINIAITMFTVSMPSASEYVWTTAIPSDSYDGSIASRVDPKMMSPKFTMVLRRL